MSDKCVLLSTALPSDTVTIAADFFNARDDDSRLYGSLEGILTGNAATANGLKVTHPVLVLRLSLGCLLDPHLRRC